MQMDRVGRYVVAGVGAVALATAMLGAATTGNKAQSAPPAVAAVPLATIVALPGAHEPGADEGATAHAPASPSPAQPAAVTATYEGVSRPSDVRELAFGIRGRIIECLVQPGDEVTTGQAIMRMDDAVQRRTVELARLQAEDQTSLTATIDTANYRLFDLEQVRGSFQSGGSNERELKDAEYRATMADSDVLAARQNLAQSAIALAREEARLAEMVIHSPIEGTVVDVHRRAGEAVDESTNVVTVIRIDPLWMDVNVSMSDALRLRRGQRAEVAWQDVDGVEAATGRVIFVSPAGHAGARQVMVRLEIPNPETLPTGMHATVRFLNATDEAAATTRAPDTTPTSNHAARHDGTGG